ncbi:RNA polymerase sigma factor [Pedobacter hiemivivus]|uniref:Sigma-70 family RNA polymerase sigma factor n=1 Tax=Pedobacter hiemivivus TaxID=2530454 RepID=A0A4R0NEH0_9SPHI|nr:sigma-70 family RNA polymerase sigma factor [Pedobacter hiemivivus]TCC98830.1 sigma-70 family RNA polymerase sigma factor [Pedobacter hiemivivus]
MNDYKKHSDTELAALLRKGDNAAFLEIYDRYNILLLNYAFRKLQDKQEAQDIVQEVFITLWEKRDSFILKTYLSGFLYKSILNKVLNIWKHNKIVREHAQLHNLNIDVDTIETDFLIREKDITAMIEREIAAMPPRMREVYELKYKQYLSTKVIATQLGISENTVSNHLKAASAHLKDKLGILIFVLYILNK